MSRRDTTEEEYREIIANCNSIADVCRSLGILPSGANYGLVHRIIKEYDIDTSHFSGKGWNRGLHFKPKVAIPLAEILVENSIYQSYKLKNRLLKEGLKEHKCECCNQTEWNNQLIPLELHHINGDKTDNRIENLQLLCPNCHAQTNNYRGKNIEKKEKVIIHKIKKSKPKKERKLHSLICQYCGKEFFSKTKKQKYCSYKCCHEAQKSVTCTREELIKDFKELKSFIKVGEKYGVSENAIRKLCKKYELPYLTNDMKEYINNLNKT